MVYNKFLYLHCMGVWCSLMTVAFFSRIMFPATLHTHCSGQVEELDEEFKVLPWPPNSPDKRKNQF